MRSIATAGRTLATSLFLVAASTVPLAAQDWPTTTPAAVGLDAAILERLASEIGSGTYGYVDRMVVIRHGKVAWDRRWSWDYEQAYGDSARVRSPLNQHDRTSPYNYFSAWWHPYYRKGDLHTLQSVTKTVTSVVIGTAVTRGEFPALDTPILTFFDTTRVANLDPRKRRITIRHLLTMTGGFDWNENLPYIDPNNSGANLEGSYDWVDYVIDRPMAREPGTAFNYSSGESELLAHIFRQATGTDIEEYAARHLFAPLGVTRWFWKRTPAGLIDTEGGLYLEALDLARIWELWLRDGIWHGTRVVSPEWVRASVTPAVTVGDAPDAPRYGYKWWLRPSPITAGQWVWAGSGFGGQVPVAIPELDLVMVFNGWNILPGQKGLPRDIVARVAAAVSSR